MEIEINGKVMWLIWATLIKILALAALCAALFYDIWWCQNIIKFYLWSSFAVSALGVVSVVSNDSDMNDDISFKGKFVIGQGIIWALLLASAGWFLYATLAVMTSVMQVIIVEEKKKKEEE